MLDAFHVVKLASSMVDEVRRRVQQDTLGHRGRTGDPLFRVRRTLQVGAEHLTEKQIARPNAKLEASHPHLEVRTAWHCYQRVGAIYHAKTEKGRDLVEKVLAGFPSCPILRDRTARPDPHIMAAGNPRLLPDQRGLQRAHRSYQRGHRYDPADRAGVPELRQLPVTQSAQCRRAPPVPAKPAQPRLITKSLINRWVCLAAGGMQVDLSRHSCMYSDTFDACPTCRPKSSTQNLRTSSSTPPNTTDGPRRTAQV